jgi:hypothetical protein
VLFTVSQFSAVEGAEEASYTVSVLRGFRITRFNSHMRQILAAIEEAAPMLTVISYATLLIFVVRSTVEAARPGSVVHM